MSGMNFPPTVTLRRNNKFIDIDCERGGVEIRLAMDLAIARAFADDILDALSRVPVEAADSDFTIMRETRRAA